MPHARLRVDIRPHHRRLPPRSSPSWRASIPTIPIAAASARCKGRACCRRASHRRSRHRASAYSSATSHAADDYAAALDRLARLGATIIDIDIEPFYETARLLYEGPWLAERYAATRNFIASSPQSMHPVTREIVLGGARPLAVDAFTAFYQLEHLRRIVQAQFELVDILALPTAPTLYTVEQVLADPIELNSRLGTYTNFVNCSICAVACAAALRHWRRRPFGITLLAPAAMTASSPRSARNSTPIPAFRSARSAASSPACAAAGCARRASPFAVVGAHLSGMPAQ